MSPLPETPETEYEAPGTSVFDPGDYYASPIEMQNVLDALVLLAGLDRDHVTMIAIGPKSIGIWHHNIRWGKGSELEYLERISATGRERFELGPMTRGDV
jgi:hypothetical protein